jgi:hypothetical protein
MPLGITVVLNRSRFRFDSATVRAKIARWLRTGYVAGHPEQWRQEYFAAGIVRRLFRGRRVHRAFKREGDRRRKAQCVAIAAAVETGCSSNGLALRNLPSKRKRPISTVLNRAALCTRRTRAATIAVVCGHAGVDCGQRHRQLQEHGRAAALVQATVAENPFSWLVNRTDSLTRASSRRRRRKRSHCMPARMKRPQLGTLSRLLKFGM